MCGLSEPGKPDKSAELAPLTTARSTAASPATAAGDAAPVLKPVILRGDKKQTGHLRQSRSVAAVPQGRAGGSALVPTKKASRDPQETSSVRLSFGGRDPRDVVVTRSSQVRKDAQALDGYVVRQ